MCRSQWGAALRKVGCSPYPYLLTTFLRWGGGGGGPSFGPKLGNSEFSPFFSGSAVLLSQPPLGQMLQLLTIVVHPAHSPSPPLLALARSTPFSPVRRIWARQRHSFRIGCPKASTRGPRAATRTPTRTRTNVARTLRPLASVATALASAAERLAGAELARRTARTACRPTSATAGACARSMAAFAQKA